MKLFTIGFTKKSADEFFPALIAGSVRRVIDVRLNNTSQLAGFSKKDDLRYFLKAIASIEYTHVPELAPTQEILDAYKKKAMDWPAYETAFRKLLEERKAAGSLDREIFEDACLLCSEEKPEHCHRRIAAEYLHEQWGDIEIVHL
ncbi:conserved hypothetical protein [Candidatus Koribacter versatilis Ellin345]|uniref:DUF488 domain-containing protein n=1 Tax=Koribacter versatilis (strain Ellin345) TaxID=204669 RepID=Q1IT42_KORVE|nr:DUF488 domain-containing protein [Candidatus Koribacter versatilis]ABF39958.1 conserved hypothetical protein [Candidatus Koribacter versatilis Ellin345]